MPPAGLLASLSPLELSLSTLEEVVSTSNIQDALDELVGALVLGSFCLSEVRATETVSQNYLECKLELNY
jgi:hypothetical protein